MRIRATRLALSLVLATAAFLALSAAPAAANYGAFGSFGSAQLGTPIGVAIDQSNGDVYVGNLLDPNTFQAVNNDKYDSAGNLISPPSPFGDGLYSGAAVNPTNGDAYVVNACLNEVDTFDPNTGAQLSSFPVSDSGNVFGCTVVQLATDSAGDVYLPNAPNNEVQEFDSSGTLLKTFTGSGADALSAPTGVAVDGSGNVWVADTGNGRIEEFDPTGAGVLGTIASAGVQAVTLDSSGDVFGALLNSADPCGPLSSPCYHVVEYSAAGTQLDDFGAGTIGSSALDPGVIDTLAVNHASGDVYVSDGGNNLIWIFGPQSAPIVSDEHASSVTGDSATLGAKINPANADTTYHFSYGTDTSYGTDVPVPDADIGTGTTVQSVSQHIQGLTAGTTYHYRVVATNTLGTTPGPDHTFTTQASAAGGPDTCPNAAIRTQQGSSFLPDCRAYEQVTPTDKGSGSLPLAELTFSDDGVQASPAGDGIAYSTPNPWPGAQSGSDGYYVASRSATGWSNLDLIPPQAATENTLVYPRIAGYTPDLSKAFLEDGGGANSFFGQDDPPLVPGEPANQKNLFLRDNSDGSWQLMNLTPQGATPADAHFHDASADGSRVVFGSPAKLTPDAIDFTGTSTENLYQWAAGAVSLVGQIPPAGATECGAGGPACSPSQNGAALGSTTVPATTLNAISADGSEVFFLKGTGLVQGTSQLYVRENGTRTVEYSASQKTNGSGPGGTDPNGPLLPFRGPASADGSHAFFTSCEQLTNDSTAVSPSGGSNDCLSGAAAGSDLYSFDVASGELSDLTVDHNAGDSLGADVRGVLGSSADGSSVYFVAEGVLATGATAGQPNLYLWRNGTTSFIATLDQADHTDWDYVTGQTGSDIGRPLTARVSPNGDYVAFDSVRSLTGYDNTVAGAPGCGTDPVDQQPLPPQCPEIFEYSAGANQLACASCNPTGARPLGASRLEPVQSGGLGTEDSHYLLRNLTDGGRLFFDSQDALVPGDTNGDTQDVYLYEDGAPHLISSGTSSYPSTFFDSSASGNDVFFDTVSPLAPQDQDQALDVYDARVGGGFPFTPPPAPCTGDACKGSPSGSPTDQAPGSSGFSGPGNPTPTHSSPPHKHKRRHRKHHRRHR